MDANDEIWFGADGKAIPSRKTFLSRLTIESPPSPTLWLHTEAGNNHEAREESKLVDATEVFGTPKPERLVRRILELATNPGDLVLDSFLGSGTTAPTRSTRIVVVNHREIPAGLLVDEVLGFRRFAESEFSGDAPPTVVRCDRFLAGAFRRGAEHWPVLSLRTLVESPSFQDAAA